jgi:hypothetical protein
MGTSISIQTKSQAVCFLVFIFILMPFMLLCFLLNKQQSFWFHPVLFLTGWFVWTFIEYIMHRFWTHGHYNDSENKVIQRHKHHHTHPTDIKITKTNRWMMLGITVSLLLLSIWLNNYFTFLAGFWTGVNWFFMIHYFLHQHWAAKVFPKLLSFHIVHHCKYPNRCFCFSLTLWDRLFGTGIPAGTVISPRIINFYFNNQDSHHH